MRAESAASERVIRGEKVFLRVNREKSIAPKVLLQINQDLGHPGFMSASQKIPYGVGECLSVIAAHLKGWDAEHSYGNVLEKVSRHETSAVREQTWLENICNRRVGSIRPRCCSRSVVGRSRVGSGACRVGRGRIRRSVRGCARVWRVGVWIIGRGIEAQNEEIVEVSTGGQGSSGTWTVVNRPPMIRDLSAILKKKGDGIARIKFNVCLQDAIIFLDICRITWH